MDHYFYYDTPIGRILIGEKNKKITHILYNHQGLPKGYVEGESETIKKAILELEEYFDGKRKVFDLEIEAEGTEFMKSVWRSLMKIPYGETRSYKDIAIDIGRDKAYRAVGLANNKNPISIIIPCHRVIGTSGKLIGYGGGLDIKEFLLELEKSNSQ